MQTLPKPQISSTVTLEDMLLEQQTGAHLMSVYVAYIVAGSAGVKYWPIRDVSVGAAIKEARRRIVAETGNIPLILTKKIVTY